MPMRRHTLSLFSLGLLVLLTLLVAAVHGGRATAATKKTFTNPVFFSQLPRPLHSARGEDVLCIRDGHL